MSMGDVFGVLEAKDWILMIGTTITAGSAIVAAVQYLRTERWKRVEFVGAQFDKFIGNNEINKAIMLIDRNNTEVTLSVPGTNKNVIVRTDTDTLIRALKMANNEVVDEQCKAIRHVMDKLFGGIENFYDYINNKVIKQKHLDVYFAYWIDVLMNERHRGKEFVEVVNNYVSNQEFYYAYSFMLDYKKRAAYWVDKWERRSQRHG